MREIKLTQNKIALVDDEDFEFINQYKWHYSKSSKNYGRAKASQGKRNTLITMHKLLMNPPKGMEVDHINGDPLDNRRANLRIVTHGQNQKNMKISADNKSGYKGVSWHKKANKWQAHIRLKCASKYLGLFTDIKEAAKAYNSAALEHFGEFARLNDIKD